MPRLLFAQLLLLGLGLGPRGAAAMRSKAKGEPAQLHSSSAGGECPLAKEWEDACYNLMGSPLAPRQSNDCQHKKVKLSNDKKYGCKVAYACTDNAKTKLVQGTPESGGKVVGWDLTHCQGLSGVTARKMCTAPPEASDICTSDLSASDLKVLEESKMEFKEALKEKEAEAEPLPERNLADLSKDDYECRCTGEDKEGEVQAVWVSKELVPEHFHLDFRKKLWASGGIANFDNSQSPCACLNGWGWFNSETLCSSLDKTQTFPVAGGGLGGYVWSFWSAWQEKCEAKCAEPIAKVVEKPCEELA